MEDKERDFKGIWIPKEIWLDNRLSCSDKCILSEIDSLDTGDGCYASNKYLSEFFGITEIAISNSISRLKKLGYVEQISFDGRIRKLKVCLKQNFKSALNKTLNNNIDYNINNNINNNLSKDNLLLNKEKKLQKKNSGLLAKSKPTKKEILYNNLINDILVKSSYYENESIRDLLIRWINSLKEIGKLPSPISLEETLLQLESNKFTNDEIIQAISKSIKSGYKTLYLEHNQSISSDNINREVNLNVEQKQKIESSINYAKNKYSN